MHTGCAPSSGSTGKKRPRFEVADIFHAHGEAYRQRHVLTRQQLRVMRDIETCRTVVHGGHLDVCDHCGHHEQAYNSCRNRHCPKCQSLRQALWVEQRMRRIVPTHYFHVVFTLPHELNPIVLYNRRLLFDLLFDAASRTLLQLGEDPKRLGATIGITAVLHTWTRDLRFHPHLHCIVTGGGLSPDLSRWIKGRSRYLFPVTVLGKLFRGKFLDALVSAHANGKLEGPCDLVDKQAFDLLKDRLYRKSWYVDARRPFAGPHQVFRYLGRYTHRVAISNHRLIHVDDQTVRFWTKGQNSAAVSPSEFIRRFLLHVLPQGFVKIRHYGLMAPTNVNTKLEIARRLLAPDVTSLNAPLAILVLLALILSNLARRTPSRDWTQHLNQLTGIDCTICPVCRIGTLVRYHSFYRPYWDTS